MTDHTVSIFPFLSWDARDSESDSEDEHDLVPEPATGDHEEETDSESDLESDDDRPVPPPECEFLPQLSAVEESCVSVLRTGPGYFGWREVFGGGVQPLARHFRWLEHLDLVRAYDARMAEARRVVEVNRPASAVEQRLLDWVKM